MLAHDMIYGVIVDENHQEHDARASVPACSYTAAARYPRRIRIRQAMARYSSNHFIDKHPRQNQEHQHRRTPAPYQGTTRQPSTRIMQRLTCTVSHPQSMSEITPTQIAMTSRIAQQHPPCKLNEEKKQGETCQSFV
ncbi:hypothetical protein HDV57DRAFT_486690 [Trichoderma longibrachiatum]|uniref:Uncharacterized protein n=1 Tax=Trichoderma longibrachiatum ATCC 18648 TaxID=983965 RepID=A0A2T4BW27_TRILO|nr:hypothetical protein M440DRAFT_1064099 [Trichoderma longibrachiatum ATCC 18648]